MAMRLVMKRDRIVYSIANSGSLAYSPLHAFYSDLVRRPRPMIHFPRSWWLSIAMCLRSLCSKIKNSRVSHFSTLAPIRRYLLIVHGAEKVVTIQAHSLGL